MLGLLSSPCTSPAPGCDCCVNVTCSATKQTYSVYLIHPQSNCFADEAGSKFNSSEPRSRHKAALICEDDLLVPTGPGRREVATSHVQDGARFQLCYVKLCALVWQTLQPGCPKSPLSFLPPSTQAGKPPTHFPSVFCS